MKNLYLIIFVFSFLMIIIFQSCQEEDCLLIINIEHDTFGLEIKDEATQEDLFFGDNAIYSEDEFEVFVKSGDTLERYFRWNTFDNSFTIARNRINDNLTDTFYVQIPNSALDTFTVNYNQEDLGECYGIRITSYDLKLNRSLVCEGCTLGETTILFK